MAFPGFKLTDAYRFAASQGLEADARAIRSMSIHPGFDKRQRHVPRKAAFVELFESKGLMDNFVEQHWPTRNTPAGIKRRQTYLDGKALHDRFLSGELAEDSVSENGENPNEDQPSDADLAAFALEAHLRDFIIENIGQIPIGGNKLRLYVDAGGRDGKEYPTGVGPIDILAVDNAGTFFVFELKLDRGPDRALGQLARYMGWAKIHLAGEHDVRGVVVARVIDEKLRYAACVIPNVILLQYEVEFRLNDVGSMVAQPNQMQQPSPRAGDMKVIWGKWKDVMYPDSRLSLGHGLCVYDQMRQGRNRLIAFVEGYEWYHGKSNTVVIYTIDPDATTTTDILEQVKKVLKEGLTKHWDGYPKDIESVVESFPYGTLTSRIKIVANA
jgi:Endonuclease NucS C-terminal domain